MPGESCMKRHHSWIVCFAMLCGSLYAQAAGPEGDLYQLGIALDQGGIRGAWEQVGEAEAWSAVRAGAILKGRLYTAESDGTLRMARLDKGKRTLIGKAGFGD